MDPNAVADLLGSWGYPALLALLLLTGVGSPIPEDLLLLSAGYLIFTDVFHWPVALAICAGGVVASDIMLYSAGRHLAWRSTRGPAGRLLSPERLLRGTRWFGRLGHKAILLARLTPGTRAIVFVTAGARAVPFRELSALRHDGRRALGAAHPLRRLLCRDPARRLQRGRRMAWPGRVVAGRGRDGRGPRLDLAALNGSRPWRPESPSATPGRPGARAPHIAAAWSRDSRALPGCRMPT